MLSVLVVGLKSVESDLQLVGFNWYRHSCAITIIEYWSLWFEYMTYDMCYKIPRVSKLLLLR